MLHCTYSCDVTVILRLYCYPCYIVLQLWCHCNIKAILLSMLHCTYSCDVTVILRLYCYPCYIVLQLWCHCNIKVILLYMLHCTYSCDVTVILKLYYYPCYNDFTMVCPSTMSFSLNVKIKSKLHAYKAVPKFEHHFIMCCI